MFNKVIFCGNFTRDIELTYMPNGGAIAKTGIASTRKFKKQDGSLGEEVCFVDVTFFGKSAENVNKYLHKGSKVFVEGRLKLDQWVDKDGAKRSKHSVTVEEFVMLDGKSDDERPKPKPQVEVYNTQGDKVSQHELNYDNVNIPDDEIPF